MLAFQKSLLALLGAALLLVSEFSATGYAGAAAVHVARIGGSIEDPPTELWRKVSLDLLAAAALDGPPDGDGAGCIFLSCIPPSDVLRYSGWLYDRMPMGISADERLAFLGRRPACHRQLILLVLHRELWSFQGLYGYFLFKEADLAPEIAEAMGNVGLVRHQAVLEEAIALFGSPYPRGDAQRRLRYGALNDPYERPADFDIALRKLAPAFGSLDDYDRALDAAIARNECLAGAVQSARAGMSLYQRLDYLIFSIADALVYPSDTVGLLQEVSNLPPFYRGVYLASRPTEVPRGLFGLFRGTEGALAPDIAVALDMLGLPEQSALIREAMAAFPAPYPTSTLERQKYLWDPKTSLGIRMRLFALDAKIERGAIIDALACVSEEAGYLPR